MKQPLKILHTSDWYLSRSLYGRRRYDEFFPFLEWLSATIEAEQIDVLLIAGDIFDTSMPSNQTQELYYRFLFQAAQSGCRQAIVIAGNHDSPTFLEAPRALLKAINVHVVGMIPADPEVEIIRIEPSPKTVDSEAQRCVQAIVCTVPYIRDRDIRLVEPGESISDKEISAELHTAEQQAAASQREHDAARINRESGFDDEKDFLAGRLAAKQREHRQALIGSAGSRRAQYDYRSGVSAGRKLISGQTRALTAEKRIGMLFLPLFDKRLGNATGMELI